MLPLPLPQFLFLLLLSVELSSTLHLTAGAASHSSIGCCIRQQESVPRLQVCRPRVHSFQAPFASTTHAITRPVARFRQRACPWLPQQRTSPLTPIYLRATARLLLKHPRSAFISLTSRAGARHRFERVPAAAGRGTSPTIRLCQCANLVNVFWAVYTMQGAREGFLRVS
jgi:hypothetical protein